MFKCTTMISGLILLSSSMAPAQTPSPDAAAAARNLVTTLRLSDQFNALLPGILLSIKPVLTQDRPEMERDFDAILPKAAEAYATHFSAMVDAAATVYGDAFNIEEMREIEAFYRKPVGQKLLQKSQAIAQQIDQIGRDASRKAADDLRVRLSEMMRPKGK